MAGFLLFPHSFRPYYLAPLVILALFLLSIGYEWARIGALIYLAILAGVSVGLGLRHRMPRSIPLFWILFLTHHWTYAIGLVAGFAGTIRRTPTRRPVRR